MDKRDFDTSGAPLAADTNTPLGATAEAGGVAFRAWAPNAQALYVLTGPALAAARQQGFVPDPGDAMTALGDGTWGAFVPGAAESDAYLYWVVGNGGFGLKRDPRARELSVAPAYPDSNCLVCRPQSYPWHDAGFRAPEFRDLILYQLHIGVFYGVDAQGNDKRRSIAKFLDLLDRVDYFADLGINAVQLMPIQEFATPTSLGYNGLDLYSPEMDYEVADETELARYLAKANGFLVRAGRPPLTLDQIRCGPDQLRCVIDILHLNGIAVLFDLVFNHAGGGFDDRSMWFFDLQPQGDNNRSLYFTDQGWAGGLVFAYWNAAVRQFLIDNGKQCFEEFHIDGIRYDEVTVIDSHGGGGFCQDLTGTLRYEKPQAIQIAEYWADDRAAAVRPSPSGLGFDAAWADKLRGGIRGALTQMAGGFNAFVDIDALAGAFDTPWGFDAAWRAVNAIENHDLVYAGRDQRIAALADSSDARSWYARSRSRVAAGLMFAARGIPQLFMGEEILEDKQWSDDINFHANLLIWWDGLGSDPVMRDFRAFCRDLIRLRRNFAALRGESLRVSTRNSTDRVMAVQRWIEGSGQDVLVVFNLQETNRFAYRVGFPSGGVWREVFNSDAYDDVGNHAPVGNGGSVTAEDGYGWDGMPASAAITIPANGFIAFAR
ncbi:MAG TPA: alpha amylase C-terminal domain-containing protein [Rhizomicrobium sp.]|nr:alpha amylase C-terminal domain-containing protein [Rhizomicrobium sp.]